MTTDTTSIKATEGKPPPDDVCHLDQLLRPLRADARRNRAKVLVAAEEVFASEGLSVPIDEVARRAGVGVGTVYRHFPTKEALFEAIVIARLEALVERAEELCAADDPGTALFTFISELVDLAVKKKDLTDELARAGVEQRGPDSGRQGTPRAWLRCAPGTRSSGRVRPRGHQPDRHDRVGHGDLHGCQPARLCRVDPTSGRRALRRVPRHP